jgi:hypothetical protein
MQCDPADALALCAKVPYSRHSLGASERGRFIQPEGALHKKSMRTDLKKVFSRKGAKRCRGSNGFLCVFAPFAREMFKQK